MKKRCLGKTGWEVSEIGIGTWGLAGDKWRDLDIDGARRTLYDAVENGVSLIDTAPSYGDGFAEKTVGQVVRDLRARDWVVVATKVPPATEEWPPNEQRRLEEIFPEEAVIRSVEQSLRHLRLDALPVAQLHVWDDAWLQHEHWLVLRSAMERLVKQGKVLHWGVSAIRHQSDNAVAILADPLIATVQVIFNIFDQGPRHRLLAAAAEGAVGVIGRCPLDEGGLTGTVDSSTAFLADDWRAQYFTDTRVAELEQRLEELRSHLGDDAHTLAELALRFALSPSELSSVIPGIRTREHLAENLGISDGRALSENVLASLYNLGWNRDWYPNSH